MNLNQYIDHTCLKPEARKKDLDKLVQEALKYKFKTVCVNPLWIKYVKKQLENSGVQITTVVGFPLGANVTQVKVFEAKLAIDHGADEIDMVIAIGKLKDKDYEYVLNDINKVKSIIGSSVLKVIIETALLSIEEIEQACLIIKKSQADFAKTSTGFSFRGASLQDVQVMKKILGEVKGLKAAGGIKTQEDAHNMIKFGATRLGTSRGVMLVTKEKTC